MRKIEKDMLTACVNNQNWHGDNTSVHYIPDIDALSREELVELQKGLSALERYVRSRHAAVKARLEGDIRHALHCERVCDGFYKHLPDWVRW